MAELARRMRAHPVSDTGGDYGIRRGRIGAGGSLSGCRRPFGRHLATIPYTRIKSTFPPGGRLAARHSYRHPANKF